MGMSLAEDDETTPPAVNNVTELLADTSLTEAVLEDTETDGYQAEAKAVDTETDGAEAEAKAADTETDGTDHPLHKLLSPVADAQAEAKAADTEAAGAQAEATTVDMSQEEATPLGLASDAAETDTVEDTDTMTQEEYEAKKKNMRQGRRMSQVERDLDDVFTTLQSVEVKSSRQRRKSVELRDQAADCVKRMSALLEMGTTTKVVLAASKWKCRTEKFKHTETEGQKHLHHMHKDAQKRQFGNFGKGEYDGVTTCFVCDTEVTAVHIKQGMCPLCATVLNHTTIKCSKKRPSTATPPPVWPAEAPAVWPGGPVSPTADNEPVSASTIKGFGDIVAEPITCMTTPEPTN